MKQFPSVDRSHLAIPNDVKTFERSKLDHSERQTHADDAAFHRDLLKLRRELSPPENVDGAVLGDAAFVLRFDDDRLLIINLGPRLELDIAPEPLLAPRANARWKLIWSSDGSEQVEFDGDPSWRIPAECAVLLRSVSS